MIVPAVTGLGKAAEESVNPDTSDVLLRLLPRLLDPVKVEADAIWETFTEYVPTVAFSLTCADTVSAADAVTDRLPKKSASLNVVNLP